MKIIPNNRPCVGWKYKWYCSSSNHIHIITSQDENRFYFGSGDGGSQPKEIVYGWYRENKIYRVK